MGPGPNQAGIRVLTPGTALASTVRMPIEICLGRALALFAHPAAAWTRLSGSGRAILLASYVTVSYAAVLAAMFAL